MAAVDPIVAEVRAIREQIAAECGFDIRRIIEEARRRQEQSGRRIISVQRERMTTEDRSPLEPAAIR
jgi:vacuolar-type H+-ATPase subunit H